MAIIAAAMSSMVQQGSSQQQNNAKKPVVREKTYKVLSEKQVGLVNNILRDLRQRLKNYDAEGKFHSYDYLKEKYFIIYGDDDKLGLVVGEVHDDGRRLDIYHSLYESGKRLFGNGVKGKLRRDPLIEEIFIKVVNNVEVKIPLEVASIAFRLDEEVGNGIYNTSNGNPGEYAITMNYRG